MQRRGGSEWVGGRRTMPAYVLEGGPYRPDVVLWVELPSELVVWADIAHPDEPVAFGEALRRAMAKPLAGAPRRPACVRVADAAAAEALRAVHPEIRVEVGPTPELDAVIDAMANGVPAAEDVTSYLEDGRVAAEDMQALFAAAQQLWHVAPWKVAEDGEVLRVDVPGLGVAGACLSVIGALGESFGFLLFPSRAGFEAFALGAATPARAIDLGTSYIALTYDRGADLAPAMRREVERHGWPVAGPEAYPWIEQRDRDGVSRPLVARDVRLVAAVAGSLAAFFVKHGGGAFGAEPICESGYGDAELEVRFTVPYEAADLFELPPPAPRVRSASRVGRNAPCPCGSGRKYKKCCLPTDEERACVEPPPLERAPDGPADERAAIHDLDEALVAEMAAYAARRFGASWERAGDVFVDPGAAMSLAMPWSVYGARVDGRRVVDWFLEEMGAGLAPAVRAWLEAQRRAWLGVWEVVAVESGRNVTVVEQLSGVVRTVLEASASRTLVCRDTVLGRVVDHDGSSVLCGVHPRPLPPLAAAGVIERARGRLRRRRAVPVERLRDGAFGDYLIKRWEEAVAALDEQRRTPPELRNTDGDPVVVMRDEFVFDGTRRDEVLARLATIDGSQPPEDDETEPCFTIVRPGNAMHASWEATVLGTVRVGADRLSVETNSTHRADDLRSRLEHACGALVRHDERCRLDPPAFDATARAAVPRPASPLPPSEAAALLRAYKTRHYADWADQPLPALAGESPRVLAMRSPRGRARVDALLKDMEHHEARLPAPERFDFTVIRAELGLH